jgi:hypothetical protein
MATITRDTNDAVGTLRRVCRAYAEFGLKYPNHYRVTFMNHPQLQLGRESYLREGSMGMRCYAHLRATVEECIKQKKFKHQDLEALTQIIWAGGHGITSLLITKPDFPWVGKDKLIDMMIDVFIEGLAA